ncbi:MAG: hypothetical protein ACJ8C4_08705 [Gemmataceae bacterium]
MALFAFLFAGTATQASEPPHLEFVEGLRARGLNDLALEYLHWLAEKPPPELRGRIPLEIAKTTMLAADQASDEQSRETQLAAAQKTFEEFVKSAPDAIAKADAQLELARVMIRRGRNELTASRREEGTDAGDKRRAAARQLFVSAIHEADQVGAAVQGQTAASVQRRLGEASYEENRAHFFHAATHRVSDGESRNDELEQARNGFEKIAQDYAPDPVAWLAKVMAGRCWLELENTSEAKPVFATVAKEAANVAPEAARIARSYQLRLMSQEATSGKALREVIRGCEEWLTKYSAYSATLEGQSMQILVAKSLLSDAQPSGETKISPLARGALQRAQQMLRTIAEGRSEHSGEARRVRGEIVSALTADRLSGSLDKLETFEESYLVAQMEVSAASSTLEAQRTAHLLRSIQALERGLKIATLSDPPADVLDAKLTLTYLYLANGDPYSAAVLGQHLARNNKRSARGAQAAAYAVAAYGQILAASRSRAADPGEIQADENRLRDWAKFMEATWPDDPATDTARFQLGLLELAARDYLPAFEKLSAIRDTFPGCAEARYRGGVAAQAIQSKDVALATTTKTAILTRSIGQLRQLKLPAGNASVETVVATCQAKFQLGYLLLQSTPTLKGFEEVHELGRTLNVGLPDWLGSSDALLAQLQAEAERLAIAGAVGQAELLLKDANYDQANSVIAPLLESISRTAAQKPSTDDRDRAWHQSLVAARRDLALTGIRIGIIANRSGQTKSALKCYRSLMAGNKGTSDQTALLRLTAELNQDLEIAKRSGDVGKQDRIRKGISELLREFEPKNNATAEEQIFLAQAYSAIGEHDKSAKLLAALGPPTDDSQPVANYRFVRLALAREYRLGKSFDRAKEVLREMMGTPAKHGWGYDNFDVRKEAIALMEDESNHAGAARMATEMEGRLMDSVKEYDEKFALRKVKPTDAAQLDADLARLRPLRERFFEFYAIEVRNIVKASQKSNDGKSAAVMERVASRIVKLEQTHPDLGSDITRALFRDVIESEPSLKTRYVSDGGKVLLAEPKIRAVGAGQ